MLLSATTFAPIAATAGMNRLGHRSAGGALSRFLSIRRPLR